MKTQHPRDVLLLLWEMICNLDLETTAGTLATSLFELATLAADIGLLVLVGTKAKVLDSFTGVLKK